MTVEGKAIRQPRSAAPESGAGVGRTLGLVTAIAVNLVLLWVVRNLGDWDLLPFLTADYDRIVGPLTIGILTTIAGRALQIVLPGRRAGILIDGVVTAVGFFVLLRILRVFPFDFDPDGFRWDLVVRFVLIVGLIGSAIGVLVAPLRVLQTNDTT